MARGKKKERKIAILGTTPSRMQGPIADDSGWEIWTIGPGGKDTHRWDRLLECHGVWPEDFAPYLNDLSNVKLPQQVMTLQPMKPAIERWAREHGIGEKKLKNLVTGDWSANVVLPKDMLLGKFCRKMWFSSSIAWLISLAMEEGATTIGLWGIDLESGEEYRSQFFGCAHFMDLARSHGINIIVPEACGLLRDTLPYPDRCETLAALTYEKKKKWLQDHIANVTPVFDSVKAEVHRQEGRLLMLKLIEHKPEDMAEAERILLEHNKELGRLSANIQQLNGELSATEYYQRMFVWDMCDPNWMNDGPH